MSARFVLVGTNAPGPIACHPKPFFPWAEQMQMFCIVAQNFLRGQMGSPCCYLPLVGKWVLKAGISRAVPGSGGSVPSQISLCRALMIRAEPNISTPCPYDPCHAKHFRDVPCLVPGSWYQDLGTKILVPRSWCQGTKILVPKKNGELERRSLSPLKN